MWGRGGIENLTYLSFILLNNFLALRRFNVFYLKMSDSCWFKRAMDGFLPLHGGCQCIDRVPCHTLQLRGHLI